MERKVAIVGAGISGLLACKYALSKGYEPMVFESQSDLGGVWTSTLETTKLQTPKIIYQFSDFPWPSSLEDMFPTGEQVLEYIRSYAEHLGLLRYVRCNAKVLSITYEGVTDEEIEAWSLWSGSGEAFANKGKWSLLLQDVPSQTEEVMHFNFVILCIGRFSDLPNMPEFPPGKGPEVFMGKVLHAKDYSALDNRDARNLIEGKRVVVVGFQKSAFDIAFECSTRNGIEHPCHLIYRTPRWNVPDFFPWGVPFPLLYLNRFAELLFHKPGEGLFHSLLATLLSPLRWLIAKFVESDIKHKHPLKKFGVVPDNSFVESVFTCLFAAVPEGFYENVEEGSIILKKAKKFSFCKDGLLIEGDEKPLEADIVILATGFKGDQKLSDVFGSSKFKSYMMGSPNSIVPLYRQCIHPRIPQLAVIGYSESLSNLFTSEMRSRWVVELLEGTFKLPTIKDMENDISKWDEFMKRYAGKYYRRACIGALHIWYNDQLCKDMGWNPKRKKGLMSELFEPYGPLDYANSS